MRFILKVYFFFYYFYLYFWNLLLKYLGPITILYYLDKDKIKNITLNYYLNYHVDSFRKGTYYAKIYSSYGIQHLAFHGEISDANKIKIEPGDLCFKRKQVILINHGSPLNVDLNILDNYKINMKQFKNPVKNLGLILKMMGLPCSHVTIIQMVPFGKKTMEVQEVDIDYLYQ